MNCLFLLNDSNMRLSSTGYKCIQINTKEAKDLWCETHYSIFQSSRDIKGDEGFSSTTVRMQNQKHSSSLWTVLAWYRMWYLHFQQTGFLVMDFKWYVSRWPLKGNEMRNMFLETKQGKYGNSEGSLLTAGTWENPGWCCYVTQFVNNYSGPWNKHS